VWAFDVKPEQVKAFERVYGPEGDWVRLFRRAPGYVGTEMRRETERMTRYLTIDRWESRAAYAQFKETLRHEYQALDARCAMLTYSERKVGDFETTTEEFSGTNK
jgi:heme-degrading monooxygenase HmoA